MAPFECSQNERTSKVLWLAILIIATSPARSIIRFFARLGVFGPFLVEALNSSFFYLPLANEFVLVALISSEDGRWLWFAYALSAAVGSVVGAFLLDLAMRRASETALEGLIDSKRLEGLKSKLATHSGRVIFIASALPPPFPFRVTLMAASALQCPRRSVLGAVFCGRALRFTIESLLILYLGRRFLRYMTAEAIEYLIYVFTVVALTGSSYTIYQLFFRRNAAEPRRESR